MELVLPLLVFEDAGLEQSIVVVVVVVVDVVKTGGSNNVKLSIVVPDERYKKSFFLFLGFSYKGHP